MSKEPTMNCPKCRRRIPKGEPSKEIKGGFFYWCYGCGLRIWIKQDIIKETEQ